MGCGYVLLVDKNVQQDVVQRKENHNAGGTDPSVCPRGRQIYFLSNESLAAKKPSVSSVGCG